MLGLPALDRAKIVAESKITGLPGIRPHPSRSVAVFGQVVLECLKTASRGVVVFGIDGLSLSAASTAWTGAKIEILTSSFPSTSVTAWTTALTGLDASQHLGIGMVYRVPRFDRMVHAVLNRPVEFTGLVRGADPPPWRDSEVISPERTIFERARSWGARCVVRGRDMDLIPGPWTSALFRGADREFLSSRQLDALPGENISDPDEFAAAVIREAEETLGRQPPDAPLLHWVYVNLDDHVHAHGYDYSVNRVLRRLGSAAEAWAGNGWTVLAHSDHGQVALSEDPVLTRAWDRLASPAYCRLPSGGAGRVRWLYPRPGKEAVIVRELSETADDDIVVCSPDDLATWGLWQLNSAQRARAGEIVIIALDADFAPIKPGMKYDHGSVTEQEMLVPLAVWSSGSVSCLR